MKKNTLKNTALAFGFAALSSASVSVLASTVDMKVIGAITPAACTPLLGGGGTIDYGTISPTALSDTDFTVLPAKSISFSITCSAPAKAALVASNGRIGTLAGTSEGVGGVGIAPVSLLGVSSLPVVGLGLSGGKAIGGYVVAANLTTTLADGTAVDTVTRGVGGTFSKAVVGSYYLRTGPAEVSWAATGTVDPVAFTALTGDIRVQAYLNKSSELDLTTPANLDGLTTLELIYL